MFANMDQLLGLNASYSLEETFANAPGSCYNYAIPKSVRYDASSDGSGDSLIVVGQYRPGSVNCEVQANDAFVLRLDPHSGAVLNDLRLSDSGLVSVAINPADRAILVTGASGGLFPAANDPVARCAAWFDYDTELKCAHRWEGHEPYIDRGFCSRTSYSEMMERDCPGVCEAGEALNFTGDTKCINSQYRSASFVATLSPGFELEALVTVRLGVVAESCASYDASDGVLVLAGASNNPEGTGAGDNFRREETLSGWDHANANCFENNGRTESVFLAQFRFGPTEAAKVGAAPNEPTSTEAGDTVTKDPGAGLAAKPSVGTVGTTTLPPSSTATASAAKSTGLVVATVLGWLLAAVGFALLGHSRWRQGKQSTLINVLQKYRGDRALDNQVYEANGEVGA